MSNTPLPAFYTQLPTQLVETAIESCVTLLRARLNFEIDTVFAAYRQPGVLTTRNVPHFADSAFYTTEIIQPFRVPACWVLPERSTFDLGAQNFSLSEHQLMVILLTEDVEIQRMNKAVWNYAIAAYKCLHDKPFNNTYFFVDGVEYSAAYTRAAGGDSSERNFQRDITLRVRARMYEPTTF